MDRLKMRLAIVSGIALGGCTSSCPSLSISPDGGKYPTPVTVNVSASDRIESGSFRVTVDGADRTAEFGSGSAALALSPGMHTVQATANVWNDYDKRYDSKSAQASFEAGPPGSLALAISPTSVTVVPNGTADINLTVSRSGAFGGNVDVGAYHPGSGTSDTTTINVFNSTGVLTVRAPVDARAAENTTQIIASGSLYSTFLRDTKLLRFRVGHLSGSFSRATFAARSAGDHAVGPDGQTTLDVDNGPPMTPRFEARFRHPTFTQGRPVGFEPGVPVSGGAGFCTTGRTGFVISGGNANTAHTLTLVLFDDVFSLQAFPIPAAPPNSTVVVPQVFFSRDCAVIIMVGADMQTQHAFRAEVYDMHRQRTLCSVPFDSPAANLLASLAAPAADNQELQITVDGQTRTCPLF